jgi:putative phage-type endonuclease
MPITQNQIELRKKSIGSSDMAAIMGLSPWKSAWDIWAEKTGKLVTPEHAGEVVAVDAMATGNRLEHAILEYGLEILCQDYGKVFTMRRNQRRVKGIMAANMDALINEDALALESKSAGIIRGYATDDWGPDIDDNGKRTDAIPRHYIIQTQHQAIVAGLREIYVPALVAGKGWLCYVVKENKDLQDAIMEAADKFWKCVTSDTPPEKSSPHLEVAKMMKRTMGKVVVMSGFKEAVEWRAADKIAKDAQEVADTLKAKVMAAAGDASEVQSSEGTLKIVKVSTTRIDSDKLRKEHPEVAEKVSKVSESTRVTWKENKK